MKHLTFKTFFICTLTILIMNSCKKKQCQGTNSISGVLKNGTTMKGIGKVQLEFQIYDYNYSRDKGENYKTVGKTYTDDTGAFHFEYPCQDKDYDRIAIDAQPPYAGYLTARETYSKNFGPKVFYYSTYGSAQIVLKPLKPLNNDTLYVGLGEYQNGKDVWIYLDTFIQNVPVFWKKHRGPTGGGRGIIWGRGEVEFNKKKKLQQFIINGDPAVDSIYVKY